MPKLTGSEIRDEGLKFLAESRKGVRWMELLNAVKSRNPGTPHNSVHGALHSLLKSSNNIIKISRGTYILKDYYSAENAPIVTAPPAQFSTVHSIQESEIYGPFADWLTDELEEATSALPVGGNSLKGKWGTPDVIGVLKPMPDDPIKFPLQIVAAEIKIDVNALVVAFGQAVAYRLFAHKSYVVIPNTSLKDDISRLEMLALIYGIGLVTFSLNLKSPDFTLLVRALPSEPDMYYVNEMVRRLMTVEPRFKALF